MARRTFDVIGGPRNAVRRVPIPPQLVALLREHVKLYGTAPDGRLFWTYRGGIYLPSTLRQVLQKARAAAFPPALVASPLARRPYDFRHAGVSRRLNAGTPGPQVAEWAGHSVEVLYRVYAHCIDGDDERWYKRMEEFLANLEFPVDFAALRGSAVPGARRFPIRPGLR